MLISDKNLNIELSVDQAVEEAFKESGFLDALMKFNIEIQNFLNSEISFSSLGSSELSLTLSFCNNKEIQVFNKTYRDKDSATDVLSFPVYENLRSESSEVQGLPLVELGDIIISLEKAEEQAREYQLSLRDELIHLLVHGLCHIVGYDHEISKQEELLMQQKESYLIQVIGKKISKIS